MILYSLQIVVHSGFYIGLCHQILALMMTGIVTLGLWVQFSAASSHPNFDDSLGIYRLSVDHPDVRLLNISDTIIPANASSSINTFVYFEEIPERELFVPNQEIFCLSEFVYRSKESQVFFNSIEVVPVSDDGRFCTTRSGRDYQVNQCVSFYMFQNFVLYYASINPVTRETEKFHDECIVVKDSSDTLEQYGPETDLSIDVDRHVNRTGLPTDNDDTPLVIIFPPPINGYFKLNVSKTVEFLFFSNPDNSSLGCLTLFAFLHGQVHYNYRDINSCSASGVCNCSPDSSPGPRCCQYIMKTCFTDIFIRMVMLYITLTVLRFHQRNWCLIMTHKYMCIVFYLEVKSIYSLTAQLRLSYTLDVISACIGCVVRTFNCTITCM